MTPPVFSPVPSLHPSAPSVPVSSAPPASGPAREAAPAPTGAVPTSAKPAGPCATKASAGKAIPFTRRLFSAPRGKATMTSSGSTTTVRFDNAYTWAGLFLDLPKGVCRYRVDLEARMVEPSRAMTDGEGWGYGLGPCNLLTNGRPFGYSLQHAMIRLDGVESGNSGVFRNPSVNDGQSVGLPADYGWHQWTLKVDGDQVTITREFGVAVTGGRVSGASGLPATCDDAGVFLRVFNGAAAFRDIGVTGL